MTLILQFDSNFLEEQEDQGYHVPLPYETNLLKP